jgi:transcriptional regulator with XRE-family HTH domain
MGWIMDITASADHMPANIARLRKSRGLKTQKALADRVGVDPSTVWHWENGSRSPSAAQIPALAAALGVTTGRLFAPPRKRAA